MDDSELVGLNTAPFGIDTTTVVYQKGQTIRVLVAPLGCDFDKSLALLETRNFERVAKLHLKRCNDVNTAKEISLILGKLAEGFAGKIT